MKIGLIAGGGQFPLLFAKKAAQKGIQVVAAGFFSETDPDLADAVDAFQWLYLGQVSKLVKHFKRHGIHEAVMLGTIRKTSIFKDIRPDFKALAFIAKTGYSHDNTILSAFADLMQKEGIAIRPSTFLMPDLLSPAGCWTRRSLDKAEKKDAVQGWKLAKAIGDLDIGQCIVISNGTVLAVEAIEGTDAAIMRGGQLAKGNGAVVVKLSKPQQDLRFDLPSAGADTIRTMVTAGATVLILEAEKSLAFDRRQMVDLADRNDIAIAALTDDDIP
ncbi:MAG TPA: UDP-2,3-diacylglucosamine diphosphatase LpxI [Desulfotignum sp.]|nr:UDP-2,3-diacylglucosamine diphosphatase LpxI [Desulfotignum sp.]